MGKPSERENTREELLEEIQRLHQKLGRRPKLDDLEKHSNFSSSKYYTAFRSWNQALYLAGIIEEDPITHSRITLSPTKHELIQGIHQVTELLGAPPTLDEVDSKSEFSSNDYDKKFNSWEAALEKAGYNPENAGKHEQITKDRLATEIYELADRLNKTPRKKELARNSKYSIRLYQAHFDSIDEALQYAGYQGIGLVDQNSLEHEIKSIAVKLGKTPEPEHILNQTGLTSFPFEYHFGSIEAAIDEVITDEVTSETSNLSEEQLLSTLDDLTDEVMRGYVSDSKNLDFNTDEEEFEAHTQMLAMDLLWLSHDIRRGIRPAKDDLDKLREELRIVDEIIIKLLE